MARALVSAGAAVDHPSSGGNWRTALHLAAAAGNVETACALLDAAVESGDSPGLSSASSGPLYAAARGQFKAIQALGRAGTSGAASSSRKLQACLSARDSGGCTPLHCAAAGGCAPSVRALLLAGAPVGEANNEGDSPLHSLVGGCLWLWACCWAVGGTCICQHHLLAVRAERTSALKGSLPLELAKQ